MKKGTTLFLKLAVIVIGAPVFILCLLGVYFLVNNPVNPDYSYILYPILAGVYVTVIPFSIALYNAFKLLTYIDNNKAFSYESVKGLKKIKYCAITISGLYIILMPFIFLLADKDDAPGAIIMGIVPAFASTVISVFAAVLQRLFEEAIEIKSENELTVWGGKMAIIINVDVMLAKRKMSVTELSERVGITMANLSILKNGKAKAIRFSTLEAICKALDCQPGDILEYRNDDK